MVITTGHDTHVAELFESEVVCAKAKGEMNLVFFELKLIIYNLLIEKRDIYFTFKMLLLKYVLRK